MEFSDLPVVEREVVRLIVMDSEERILLFHTHEPLYPEQGRCWELPGGGIEKDETLAGAALRELGEEAGIGADPGCLRPLGWRRRVTFRHAGERRLQNEAIVLVTLSEVAPEVDPVNQLENEQQAFLGYRWWTLAELEASSEQFFPGTLQRYLRLALTGETIEEPFEHFS